MAKVLHRYDEGIDLLYMSNTFNVSSEYLLTRLSNYILPARLAQMSKFEVFLRLEGHFTPRILYSRKCNSVIASKRSGVVLST